VEAVRLSTLGAAADPSKSRVVAATADPVEKIIPSVGGEAENRLSSLQQWESRGRAVVAGADERNWEGVLDSAVCMREGICRRRETVEGGRSRRHSVCKTQASHVSDYDDRDKEGLELDKCCLIGVFF
jgi:hypothetical protein